MLDVKNLSVLSEKLDLAVSDISFDVKEGEIVGVAGVQGNGQTELVEALTGLRSSLSGKISYFGEKVPNLNPRKIHQIGVRHIPEDRQKSGIIGNFSVSENLILNNYYAAPYSKYLKMDWDVVGIESQKIIKSFDIRTPSNETLAQNLSGGNQQKLVVGREMSSHVDFLIASQPTRGIDVGSIEYIHEQLIKSRNAGKGILLVSTELEEILALSDRILVLFRGQIIEKFGSNPAPEQIGLAMAGHSI